MKKIIKYFALSAAVLMSASACAPSADQMVENLKNDGFVVEEAPESVIKKTETALTLALKVLGEDDPNVTILRWVAAIKAPEVSVNEKIFKAGDVSISADVGHAASIIEFENGDMAQKVWDNALDALESEEETEANKDLSKVSGSCIVSWSDDYTKGILGV